MSILKLYECDTGVTINDVRYDFLHVTDVQIENNEANTLARGVNSSGKGIAFRTGITEPKKMTFTVIGVSKELHGLLTKCFDEQTEVTAYAISRKDGSSVSMSNAVLTKKPVQGGLTDSADSMNTVLEFESFILEEIHNS